MAHLKLDDLISHIIDNVKIDSFLLLNGYKYHPKENLKNMLCFVKEDDLFNEKLFIGYINGLQNFYSFTFKDSGNIIQFIMNRVDKDPIYNDKKQVFEPNKNNLIEAIRIVKTILIEKKIKKTNIESKNISSVEFKDNINKIFTASYFAKPIFYFDYLNRLKIKNETIQNYLFKNRIYNVKNFNENISNDTYTTVFPLHLNKKECGLYFSNIITGSVIKKKSLDFFAANSNKFGIWTSNSMKRESNTTLKFCFVSNPKEALAHYQYLKKDRTFIAVFDIDKSTIKEINTLIPVNNNILYFSFNSSLDEIIKEIKLILALKKELKIITIESINNDFIIFKYNEKTGAKFKKIADKMIKFNDFILKLSLNTLGNWSKSYVTNTLMNSVSSQEGEVFLKIPKNEKTLYHFIKIILNTYCKKNVFLEKPRYTNWSNQLIYDENKDEKLISIEEKIKAEFIY